MSFPGFAEIALRFDLHLIELQPNVNTKIAGSDVCGIGVQHFGSSVGEPPLGLRFDLDGKIIAHTGDTQ